MTALLPIFLKLSGRPVLLVGGGPVAAEKLPKLLAAGAQVHLVTKALAPECAALALAHPGQVRVSLRSVRPADVDGQALVLSATADPAVNQQVVDAARARGIWANAADDPERCDLFMAATLTRGPVTIAIGSSGAYPGLTRSLRRLLDAVLPEDLGDELAVLVRLRQLVRGRLGDPAQRVSALKKLTRQVEDEYLRPHFFTWESLQ